MRQPRAEGVAGQSRARGQQWPPRLQFCTVGYGAPGDRSKPVQPKTQYTKSGDVNIAFQVFGEGQFDLVFVYGFVSH